MSEFSIFSPEASPDTLAKSFRKNGFLVIQDFYQPEECRSLMHRMNELIQTCDIETLGSIFSSVDSENDRDRYFRESGDKICFFLEKDAKFSPDSQTEDLLLQLNKAGHALHDLDPIFNQFSRKPKLAQLAATLGVRKPLLLQSMYIFKPPKIGGEVRCHQDSTYMYTEPDSLIGFWVALEDANSGNGCLWVKPGSHTGPLRERFHYQNGHLEITTLDSTPMEEADLPLEVEQGTLVVLHGRLAHRSRANTSSKSRHAYTLHIIDGTGCYLPDNWLQRKNNMPLKGFF